MMELKEKKELIIENKIINANDLISLINNLHKLSNEILEVANETGDNNLVHNSSEKPLIKDNETNKGHSRLEFTSTDHSKFTGSFEDTGEINIFLETRKIIEINIYFIEPILNSSFLIRIKNSDSSPVYVKVEGQNKIWVNKAISKIDDFFSGCKNQSGFAKKYGIFVILISILLFNFFLNNSMEIVARRMHIFQKYAMQSLSGDWRFYIILLSLITISPSLLLYKRLREIFPGIEIQTGKNFGEIEKAKRNKVRIVALIILIPALITYLLTIL